MKVFLLSMCLSVCLSPLNSAWAAPEPRYVVTVPAQISYPSTEQACVNFYYIKGPVTLKMELEHGGTVRTVAEDNIDTPKYSNCYSFQVPAIEEEEQVWSFHVFAEGASLNINQTKKILVSKSRQITFIETDKPMYKPGDTVNFRVVTLDKSYRALNDKYPVVELVDPNENRIGQWLDVTPNKGIADFFFPLASELPLGKYSINIPNVSTKMFSVAEYVLKRFQIQLHLPTKVGLTDESFTAEVCGSYTYGKPVQGSVQISACLTDLSPWAFYYDEDENFNENSGGICQEIIEGQTDGSGCFSTEINLRFFNFSSSTSMQQIKILSSLKESISGHLERESNGVRIETRKTMEFVDIDNYYQKGIPFTGMLKIQDINKNPMKNTTVYLVVEVEDVETNLTLVSNEDGLAHFNLDTSEWTDMVSLKGKISSEEMLGTNSPFVWLLPFYSESNSFLKVETIGNELSCDSKQPIRVEYTIDKKELDPECDYLIFHFMIMSKGGIYSQQEHKLHIPERSVRSARDTLQGSFTLHLPVTIDLFPEATVLVYSVFLDGEVAADRALYKIPMCYKNKVELEYSEKKVQPGEKVNLEVKAESGSMCSVRAVDKGLLLHKDHEKNIHPVVFKFMEYRVKVNKRGFPYRIEDFERYPCLENEESRKIRTKRRLWAPWHQSDADVYSLFKESSLKIFTNTRIRKPVSCVRPDIQLRYSLKKKGRVAEGIEDTSPDTSEPQDSQKSHLRKFFPETWLYDLVSVGPKGSTWLNLTTPDSITEWVTDAFCLGPSGFGMTTGVGITTFKNYFIDLTLPYSVVQGEEFPLTALVFNYLKQSMLVAVSLSETSDFTVKTGLRQETSCISADETKSFTWDVTTNKPGTIRIMVSSGALQLKRPCSDEGITLGTKHLGDSLEKILIVKPRGELEEMTQTSLLCPSAETVRADVSLKVPDNLIEGSEHAHITVLGNIMGNTISNVGRFLRIPFGCGEQNLVIFAPNIYILQYLKSSHQLTPVVQDTAINYLTTGYQRQLMFKHDNGSYSAFGKKDKEGNTWLTAFTMRSFNMGQEFIYIDEKHILDAARYLKSLQQPNGCFQSVGKLFNNKLKSEVDDEVTLASYIAISFLEHNTVYHDVVDKTLDCLKDSVDKVNSTYSLVLLAYAFTLSGDLQQRKHVLDILEERAVKTDGSKHWELDSFGTGGTEMSAYVVLALLSKETTSHKDIEEASEITSWIIKQQNPFGGFTSTQDTVVALQALALYAKNTYSEKEDVKVTVRSLSGFQEQLHVDKSNSFLLQRVTLPDIPGEYTVTAVGSGCVYVQTHLKYHIPPPKSEIYFGLTVSTQPAVCTEESQTGFNVLVETSYSGNRISSNMAMIEVDLLTGFFPDKKSVKKLEKNPNVRRTEVKPEKVIIYLEELSHEKETFSFSVVRDTLVRNLQPASVRVYDYYAPDEHAVAEYNAPCAPGSEIKESI